MDDVLKKNSDRTGIAGLLMRLQDDVVSARDREIPLAQDVLRRSLDAFAADRQRAGKSEKTGTKAFWIKHAVKELTEGKSFDENDGEWLPEKVASWLEKNPPDKFPDLCDKDREIRRVLKRMKYLVPKPDMS